MLRSFCVGALVGFLFGSSKKGHDVREGIDGFLTELTSGDTMKMLDEKKDEFTEMASKSIAKFSHNETNGDSTDSADKDVAVKRQNKDGNNNGHSFKSGNSSPKDETQKSSQKREAHSSDTHSSDTKDMEQNFEPQSQLNETQSGTAMALDADKAQELADKLGAKPSTPEDENLAAFSHPDEELKSA
jgi:hypothetical protein